MKTITLAAVLLALLAPAAAASTRALPEFGVFVPGRSLAGIRLGDTGSSVAARFGRVHQPCTLCDRPTWLYTYPDRGVGLAVSFDARRRVVAVFTLGAPAGWRSREGLPLGAPVQGIAELYGRDLRPTTCVGYVAWSRHGRNAVTSFYSDGDVVYGFALARPGEPICQ
jgi:hypothetical protein